MKEEDLKKHEWGCNKVPVDKRLPPNRHVPSWRRRPPLTICSNL